MVADENRGDAYWDEAGARGYGQAMYSSSDVESHVRGRCWQQAIDIANALGAPSDGHVLDLGCGDGAFANQILASTASRPSRLCILRLVTSRCCTHFFRHDTSDPNCTKMLELV